MSDRNFSLAAIIPQGLTFTDDGAGGDGAQYQVRLPSMFTSYEYARLAELQTSLPEQLAAVANAREQGPESGQVMTLVDQAINEILSLLVPDLPEQRIKAIPLGYKLEFMKWWKGQLPTQPKAADQIAAAARVGEVQGRAPKTRRGKRSPDSSASTA